MEHGKYIVIEGPPGVGRTTQLRELARKLETSGVPFRVLTELANPQVATAQSIQQLINDPAAPFATKTEALLYNAVRVEVLQDIKKSLEQGITCVVDGDYLTTLALQYYGRGDIPDYQTINAIIAFAVGGIEPDLTIVLDATAQVLKVRSAQNPASKSYDEAFLERLRAGYLWEAKQRGLQVVFATEPPEKVADEIWVLVQKELGDQLRTPRASSPTSIKQIIDQKHLPAPHEPPLNITEVDEADGDSSKENQNHFNLKAVSALALVKIQAAQLAQVERQEVDYRTKKADGAYRYFIPKDLAPAVRDQYVTTMDTLFDTHTNLVDQLSRHLGQESTVPRAQQDEAWTKTILGQASQTASGILPVAALSACSLQIVDASLTSQVLQLLSQELPEAREVGAELLSQARDTTSTLMADLGKPELARSVTTYNATTNKNVAELTKKFADNSYAQSSDESVTLVDYAPRNELNLVSEIIYEHSSASLRGLRRTVDAWTYEQKQQVFSAYLGTRSNRFQMPGPAVQKARYSWDVVTSFDTCEAALQQPLLETITMQSLTPRLGYDTPDIIEEAGLTDSYEDCYAISLQLYSLLQENHYELESQYATLRGHKLRWKVAYNALEAFGLHELPTDHSDYNKLVDQMHQKLAEVHPLLAEAMKFTD